MLKRALLVERISSLSPRTCHSWFPTAATGWSRNNARSETGSEEMRVQPPAVRRSRPGAVTTQSAPGVDTIRRTAWVHPGSGDRLVPSSRSRPRLDPTKACPSWIATDVRASG
jgi:hypothetical protein